MAPRKNPASVKRGPDERDENEPLNPEQGTREHGTQGEPQVRETPTETREQVTPEETQTQRERNDRPEHGQEHEEIPSTSRGSTADPMNEREPRERGSHGRDPQECGSPERETDLGIDHSRRPIVRTIES
jgi:hypothetical protein